MKICSLCGTTYDGRVDFCFKDGTPLEDAPEDAVREASPFDEELPDVGAPSAPVGGTDLPEPRNLRFDDVPEPAGLRKAGVLPQVGEDLPEPAFLKPASPEPEPEPEPVAAPPPPSPSPSLAPLSESPTIPVPLDQAQPFFDAEDEPQQPPEGTGFAESTSESEAVTDQARPDVGAEEGATEPVDEPEVPIAAALEEPGQEEPPEDLEATMDASPEVDAAPEPELDDSVSFDDTPAWADTPDEPAEEKKGPPMGLIFGGLIALVLVGGGGFLLMGNGDEKPSPETVEAPAPPKAKAEQPPAPTPAPAPEPEPEPEPNAEEDVVADAEDEPVEDEPETVATPPRNTSPRAKSQPQRQPEAAPANDNPWGTTTEAPTASARLKVTSEPVGARIYIDGKDVGTSPLEYAVSAGNHKIRAEKDGYEATEILSKVDGAAGQAHVQLRKKPEATPAVAMVSLFGPAGAQVFVNGKSIGVLPIDTQLAPGSYQFKVMTADGTAYTVNGTIQAGAQNRLPLLPP